MERLLHFRGDVWGMFILFFFAFLGGWQLLVAFYRLNGLSLTGYPDRRCVSIILGSVLVAGSCSWYFNAPGHFVSPDVEGVETLIVLIAGLVAATLAQAALASVARIVTGGRASGAEGGGGSEDLMLDVGGVRVPASFRPAAPGGAVGSPVILLHDYGGSRREVEGLAVEISTSGSPVLSVDLDGHGSNPRGIDSADMKETLDEAARVLSEKSDGRTPIAVGIGLGGTLALEVLRRGTAARAVALDPPARYADGFARVNVLRELGPLSVARSFLRPPARGAGVERISLSRLLRSLPVPLELPEGKAVIVGTTQKWLNSPYALAEYARLSGAAEPELIDSTHRDLPLGTDTVR